jgi:mannose-6-phosphate isomerase-like protein (cupin superfamily)
VGKKTSMKHVQIRTTGSFFRVVAHSPRSQAATMVLKAGQTTGGEENTHPDSDQWLLVLSGAGRAIVNGRTVPLTIGSLLLIEPGDAHEIANHGRTPLVTLNIYAPPAY